MYTSFWDIVLVHALLCLGINLMHGSYGRAIIIFEIAIEVTGEIWITMAPSSQGIKYYSLVLDWVRWDLEKQPRMEQRSVPTQNSRSLVLKEDDHINQILLPVARSLPCFGVVSARA